jgi:hypothetical protein
MDHRVGSALGPALQPRMRRESARVGNAGFLHDHDARTDGPDKLMLMAA